MEFNIIARHFKLTKPIADYVNKKVSAVVRKFYPEVVSVHVVMSIQKKYIHSVEIVATAPHAKFLAKGQTADLYAAVDLTVDKLERQLRKYKEKMKEHRKRGNKNDFVAKIEVLTPRTSDITETKTFNVRVLSVENAIENMLSANYSFYVFKNAESMALNIVYKRGDDTFGLIDLKQ